MVPKWNKRCLFCFAIMHHMNTETILAELVKERDRINGAIQALSGGAVGTVKVKKDGSTRKPRTPEQKAAQAEKMKAYWSKRRKTAAKEKKA
jgi:hypothetical protein